MRAAGVMVVASAGNNGSACGSVLYPIGSYDASYSVGSVDRNGLIATSSSRGPVTYNGTGIAKPDISAPGVGVRSAHPPDGYRLLSGTSMAAPHVAGIVALLWSAYPSLIGQIDASEALLNGSATRVIDRTCGPAGSPDYNHTYGWGYADALAAVRAAAGPPRLYLPVISRGD
jgi:subtilisin family serine protease